MITTPGLQTTVQAQQNLPQMGEPADNALSPQQEKRLGRQFMRQIRAQLPLIRDTQTNEYLMNLGTRLAASVRASETREFSFFIIDDLTINAFAIPGGYIGVNAGLAQAMQREEQLAGVIAHEIAHVTQRHHARAYASAGKNRMSTAAAILAALLIGSSNPEAGQAALAAGLAISQQSSVNYTRSHEYEADRIGIGILANAGLDPAAIAETFEIMRRRNSLNTSSNQIEYLRTHPLDNNRIAEARSRANRMRKPKHRARQINFSLFQARLSVLSTNDEAQLQHQYQARWARDNDTAAGYALALLAAQNNQFEKANDYLQPAIKAYPDNMFIRLLEARLLQARGKILPSTALYEELMSVYPGRYPIVEQYAEHLSGQRKFSEAAAIIKRYQRNTSSPNPLAWRELANIQEQLGQQSTSHESLARYFLALDELGRAKQQLELALRKTDRGSKDELRLSAQLRRISAELEELQRN
ncbi:MAG: M48 family metalloprotease [Granulosicoccus sp.]|nr:M48 family metalloprotease [Granulosicoccus sp.]